MDDTGGIFSKKRSVPTASELRIYAEGLLALADEMSGDEPARARGLSDDRRAEQRLQATASEARRIYLHRRRREKTFDPKLFAEPAWDMLLDLVVQQAEGRDTTITSLGLASSVPATTALRWIDVLESAGLISCRRSATDQRTRLVRLTPQGLLKMDQHLNGNF